MKQFPNIKTTYDTVNYVSKTDNRKSKKELENEKNNIFVIDCCNDF